MREISRITPTPSTGRSQRFAPWAIAASILVAVLLVLGIGYHYLNRFRVVLRLRRFSRNDSTENRESRFCLQPKWQLGYLDHEP